MWKVQLICVLVFAVLGEIECAGPSAGKCNIENIVPVPLPITEMEKHASWRVLYATDLDPIEYHETYVVKQIVRSGQHYKMHYSRILKDNTKSEYNFTMKYVDNVLIEDTVDKNGERHRYYRYPLELATSSYAFLVYRCYDAGDPNIFYRFITAPADSTPTESQIQQLLARDKAIFGHSHGSLIKLPEEI